MISASKGPALVNEPMRDKSNPSSVMFLLRKEGSAKREKILNVDESLRDVCLVKSENGLVDYGLDDRRCHGTDQIESGRIRLSARSMRKR